MGEKQLELTDKQRSNREISNANLKPFEKGSSGNPKGRPPKDVCITSLVKELLLRDAGHGKTYADLVAETIIKGIIDEAGKLKHGVNVPLIRELLERIDGRVTEKHQVELTEPAKYINVVTPRAVGISEN